MYKRYLNKIIRSTITSTANPTAAAAAPTTATTMSYIPPILTGSLPIPLPGPHTVGYATLRHNPSHPYTLPVPSLPTTPSGTSTTSNSSPESSSSTTSAGPSTTTSSSGNKIPALGVRQTEYSVYYPCEKSTKAGWFWQRGKQGGSISWLPRPIDFVLEGWRRFANDHPLMRAAAPIIKFTGGRLTAPLLPLAPLLASTTTSDPNSPTLPLIIFSHGLAGTKNAYSAVCSALASEGNVVLAIAHADGSGPGVILHPGGDGGEEVRLGYLKFGELDWSPERTPDVMHLRSLQLDIRVAEVYETYASFKQLVRAGGQHDLPSFHLYTDDGPPPAISGSSDPNSAWLDSWRGRVRTDEVSLVGHSFGGGTLLHLLSTSPPKGFDRLPVKRAVALDPWVDPLPMPGPPKSMQEAPPRVPILAINSEGFTLWKTHFTRLSGMLRKTGGSLVSIIGCDHQTFSDFPLLLTAPSATKLVTKINSLVNSFLHDRLAEDPEVKGKTPDHGDVRTKRNEKGKTGIEGAWAKW